MSQQQMFGLNMYLIIGAVLLLGVLLVLTLVGVTVLRAWLWHRSQRRSQRDYTRTAPDGRPQLPTGRGLCDRCGRVYDAVYYLPSGARRCPTCYAAGETP